MVLIDDVGSFPLPHGHSRELLSKAARLYTKSLVKGIHPDKIALNKLIRNRFILPVQEMFELKQNAGVDIPNYPQFRDMNGMFLELIDDDLNISTNEAIIPELAVLNHWASSRSNKMDVKVCITGAFDLAIAKFGTHNLSKLILDRFSNTVIKFMRNLNTYTDHLNIKLVSLDEPSIGQRDFPPSITGEMITSTLEQELSGVPRDCQVVIHLHSLTKLDYILKVPRIDIIGAEFASDPANYSCIDKDSLISNDKQVRAGIAITSLDSLVLKYSEENDCDPAKLYQNIELLSLVLESESTLKSRLQKAVDLFGIDRIAFAGPDCGLISWKYPDLAFRLLDRSSRVVKNFI